VALEVGPSERVICLLTIEMTLYQIMGNWYFIKHYEFTITKVRVNVVFYFIVIFLNGLCNPLFSIMLFTA
jgi:hypothetical protein